MPSSQCVTHHLGSLAILQNMIYLSVFLTFVKIIGYYSNLWHTILLFIIFIVLVAIFQKVVRLEVNPLKYT